jgi:iron complex transport system substrate-binding protein
MKKQSLYLLGFMLLALSFGCSKKIEQTSQPSAASSMSTVTVVTTANGQNYTMEFREAPSRAVSLSGFTTEMMLALGLEKRMAGTAYEDNEVLPEYKAAYESIPKLSDKYPSQEVLLSASPDFATGWKSAFSEKNFPPPFLEKNNIKFFIPYSEYNGTMEAVYEDFTTLGRIFHAESEAAEIVADMKKKIGAVNDKVKNAPPVSVFVYDSGEEAPYTAGAALPSELIRLAGGANVFETHDKYWLSVQWESVVDKNPQWIVVMQYNVSDDAQGKIDFLKNNPALQGIDGIKNNRDFVLGLSDVVAGVRNAGAVEHMAKQFHPEAFQ